MTATPERTDGLDIFPLFDHNVAFEIRLQRALNEDMLVHFTTSAFQISRWMANRG